MIDFCSRLIFYVQTYFLLFDLFFLWKSYISDLKLLADFFIYVVADLIYVVADLLTEIWVCVN